MIRFRCSSTEFSKARADAVALPAWGNGSRPAFDGSARIHKTLGQLCRADRFRAKRGEVLLYHAPGSAPAGRYLVVGLGPKKKVDLDSLRAAASAAARRASAMGAKRLALQLPQDGPFRGIDPVALGQAVAEGVLLGTFRFDRYRSKKDDPKPTLSSVDVLVGGHPVARVRAGLRRGRIFAEAANFARELVNVPASDLTPLKMAEIARQTAKKVGLQCKVLRLPEIRRLGMGGIVGVSRGSVEEPCLIHLRYRPSGKPRRRVALVGKGITFDSGGLSLKSASGMESMKCDMAGSAAVLGVMRALPELGVRVQVEGLMAMSENLPSGTAQKPGDVLHTMSGKTVEVVNTDAEGRLVLADALAFAAKMKPDEMIDLATLTGACVVALGPLASGLMGTDQKLLDSLLASARACGEKMWPLPLYEEYMDMLRSPVADMKNSAERWGGALTAGLFLREFVPEGLSWVHMDIAGPAFLDREQPYLRRGGTGAGVRTLLDHLEGMG